MIRLQRQGRGLRVLALSLVFLLASLIVTTVSLAGYQRVNPYKCDLAFWDPWYEPHYGAFFGGVMGYGQRYIPGGAPGIENWNWWGYQYNVLLIPKTWYWSAPAHRTPSNYDAMLCFGSPCPS